ncbi:MAG: hypothetical protein AB1351_02160 [Thermoproteota archaeon]
MPAVPESVMKFAESIPHPIALIGCRTTDASLDCCEYDLAVFAPVDNQVVRTGGYTIEIVHFSESAKNYAVELGGMSILKDSEKFALSSAAVEVAKRYKSALAAAGRKSLISSLFCQQKMSQSKHPAVAAMWLKIAAYDFMEGTLALSGIRPMPLHELEQIRQIGSATEGMEVALECIGTERATRPAISRSLQAVMELKSEDYDRELFATKADYMLEKSMLTDCYYYAGRVAVKNLVMRTDQFHNRYVKLVQLALDLSSDEQHLEKLQKKLFRAARGGLKA